MSEERKTTPHVYDMVSEVINALPVWIDREKVIIDPRAKFQFEILPDVIGELIGRSNEAEEVENLGYIEASLKWDEVGVDLAEDNNVEDEIFLIPLSIGENGVALQIVANKNLPEQIENPDTRDSALERIKSVLIFAADRQKSLEWEDRFVSYNSLYRKK